MHRFSRFSVSGLTCGTGLLVALVLLLAAGSGDARDWHVHPREGNDDNAGTSEAPLATPAEAIRKASSGDRIVLHPEGALYRQSLPLDGAAPGLVIEGNGVTLTGADPLPEEDWESLGNELHRLRVSRPPMDRHLLIVEGRAQRMGRAVDNPIAFPSAGELEPGEFRFDPISETEGWLTFHGDPVDLEWSVRRNGISTSSALRNLHVHRIHARHFLNDGFNIHGDAQGLRFHEIRGYENFDEGFSAHDTASCWVYDSVFEKNENAVADVNAADTFYRDCRFANSEKYEVLFRGGRHSLEDCVIQPGPESLALRIQAGRMPRESSAALPASLTLRGLRLERERSPVIRWEVDAGATVFVDAPSASALADLSLDRHPSSTISETLYLTFPIGRKPSGSPLMAWVAGGPGSSRSRTYRLIHFDKHLPSQIAEQLAPENDWFGLSEALPEDTTFPPEGPAYAGENAAAHAIWRWIGLTAPDAVFVPRTPAGLALAEALRSHPPAEVGMVSVFVTERDGEGKTRTSLLPPVQNELPEASDAMTARLARSPGEVFDQLSKHYGQTYSGSYIQALALIAKMRRDPDFDPAPLASPFLSASLPQSGGSIASALLYAEWGTEAAEDRFLRVADLAFDASGQPREAMPHHGEMSDALFMGGPVLATAGQITGEDRYFAQALRQVRFVQDLCLRDDGLYRHSPLCEAAWGRGNGFPVLGLVLMLESFPSDHPDRGFLQEKLIAHLEALAPHQNQSGMWRQIIDRRDSYAEFSATAMIAHGIARGIREGWLDRATWLPRLQKAWEAVKARIGNDGDTLVDVCTGTGKQASVEDYYRREAILGHDDRGGAMALLLAGEMERLLSESESVGR